MYFVSYGSLSVLSQQFWQSPRIQLQAPRTSLVAPPTQVGSERPRYPANGPIQRVLVLHQFDIVCPKYRALLRRNQIQFPFLSIWRRVVALDGPAVVDLLSS